MPQLYKLGKHATTVRHENGKITVRLYQTDIISWDDKTIKLNSGGWKTQTTKNRMNQASYIYGLGYSVFQKKGVWFVKYREKVIKWDNNRALTLGRKVLSCPICGGEHIQRGEGHKLNQCLSCHRAFREILFNDKGAQNEN